MRRLPLFALNTALPGAGLVLRARLGVGLALLLPALALLSVGVLGFGLRDDPAALLEGAAALVAYLGCSLLAAIAWWWDGLHRPVDGAAVLALHHQAASAYLKDQLPAAEEAARRLTRLLPEEPGAWRLLELVARARGEAGVAAGAGQRARRLDNRQP
jgi:hypothetical protein